MEAHLDVVAENIRAAKRAVQEVQNLGIQMHDKLHEVRQHLIGVVTLEDTKELLSLIDQAQHMIELSNSMERGSFAIAVNREMEAAWKRLP